MVFQTKEQIEVTIFEIAESELEKIGGYVVEVRLKGSRGSRSVVVTADTDQGITLDEIAEVSKNIEQQLDDADLLTEKYLLEVSSPGLDRPLQTARDFKRRLGENVSIEHTSIDYTSPTEGKIEDVSEDSVTVKTDEKTELVLPLEQIIQAKVVLEW